MSSRSEKNLILYTTVSSIWAIVLGFIGPFYVLRTYPHFLPRLRLCIAFDGVPLFHPGREASL